MLAQAESVQNGTSTRRNGDKLTKPIILKEGMYNLVGRLYDSRHDILRESVVESIEVSEETADQ